MSYYITKKGLGGAAAYSLAGIALLYAIFSIYHELQVGRMPANYQLKMFVMQFGPLAAGMAFGAAFGALSGYKRVWVVGLVAMLPLAIYMFLECIRFGNQWPSS